MRPDASGFTLLELVLVMVIICSVLGMAAPSLRGFFASRQTSDAAAQIVALTQLARTLAVSEGNTYRLNFDTEAGAYWLTTLRRGAFQRVGSEYGRVFLIPDGTRVRVEEGAASVPCDHIEFYPNGRQAPATVQLTGRQGEVVKVTCPSPSEAFAVVKSEE